MKRLLSTVLVAFFFLQLNCNKIDSPAVCADVSPNATIQRIGYNALDSMLYISFINDISLKDFRGSYQKKKSYNQEVFAFPQGSEVIFNDEIWCYDTCELTIPVKIPSLEIRYVYMVPEGFHGVNIPKVAIDTNGQHAAEYWIFGYEDLPPL